MSFQSNNTTVGLLIEHVLNLKITLIAEPRVTKSKSKQNKWVNVEKNIDKTVLTFVKGARKGQGGKIGTLKYYLLHGNICLK